METKQGFHFNGEIPVKQPGCGCEQAISRILYLCGLAASQEAIIYLGRQLPGASCDQPGGWQASNLQAGPRADLLFPLLGLAPNGVYPAS